MNQYILVTGGCGYIGSHFCLSLIENGFTPVIVDDLSTGNKELLQSKKHFYRMSFDDDLVLQIIKKYNIKTIVHFAASIDVEESTTNPLKYYVNNVSKTIKLLNIASRAKIDNFIFSSTCMVYGDPIIVPMAEDHPKIPLNPYGISKNIIENCIEDIAKTSELKYLIFRYFNVVGASSSGKIGSLYPKKTHIVSNIIKSYLDNDFKLKLYGDDYQTRDGTTIRDYIHIDDLVNGHIKGLEYLFNDGDSNCFNLGSEKGYTVKEVINTASNVLSKKIDYEVTNRRSGDAPVLIANCKKAKGILNWSAELSLEEMIESALKWEKSRVKK